jgi:hypothetical protein
MACTGPVTEAGKAISSQNALKSGATSRAAVLPWEDQARYDALVADTIERARPHGDRERELAYLVATTLWRCLRLLRIEAEFMSSADADGTRPGQAVANLFGDKEGSAKLRLMLRYVANASREHRAAVAELRRVQAERAEAQAEQSLPELPDMPDLPVETPAPRHAGHTPASPPAEALSRAERRAFERMQHKAEKKARQAAWTKNHPPAEFVSYSQQPQAA